MRIPSASALVSGGLAFCFVLGGSLILWASSLEIPDLRAVDERLVSQSTKLYDRTGQVLLYDFHDTARRTLIPIEQISRHARNATVAIEDAEFYEHAGVKPTAIVRAVLANFLIALHLSEGYTQGGSTITQQVIKNALLTTDKTLARKLKEWVLALKLEQVMTKDKILEIYLNESPYGGSVYGIEEASESFFGKRAADLSLAEAVYLAALPQAPTYYSPYGNHRDALETRKNLVLQKMLEAGFVTESEIEKVKKEEVVFKARPESSIEAPHFVFFVEEYLTERYGARALQEGGFKVVTSLDISLQREAEELVKSYAIENEKNFNAENAGVVALQPQSGEILAMVGSRDYFDTDIDGNYNITLANRQPGSAFKPFVYAAALSKGYEPETVLFDVRTQFSTACQPFDFETEGECYSPGNYDNVFRGPVSLRNALAQSINVPAVKLLYLVGIEDAIRLARAMGITTLGDPGRYGLTLVLGGGEVRLLDMTSAYGVFATGGMRVEPSPVLRVTNRSGTVLEEHEPRGVRILSEEVSMEMNDILSDNAARSPAFGETSALYFPGRDVAAKTGTTNDYRDAWIVGYTPTLAIGAWAGNNDNSPMEKRVAGFIVAPLWHAVMEKALARYESLPFPRGERSLEGAKPIIRGLWQGQEEVAVDTRTGLPATASTPSLFREIRVKSNVHSILHFVDKDNPLGTLPVSPAEDPQYRLWEPTVRAWSLEHGFVDGVPVQVP